MKKIAILFSIPFLFSLVLMPVMVSAGTASVSLGNPLGNATPHSLIGRIIDAILGIIGSLALLMFIFGGITWMTSAGSPEKIKKGRDILIWASIGLAIVFFSYAIVKFVIFDIIGG